MFSNKKLAILAVLVMVAPLVLAACGPTPAPSTVVQTVVVEQTKVVPGETVVQTVEVEKTVVATQVVEVTPTPVPVTRKGAWVDSVIVVEEPNSAAGITRLESGELDVYAYAIADSKLYKRVKESPDLSYVLSYGSYNEITFNPAGPVFTTTNTLNPFAVPKVREAMNWLIDRDYIVQEIFGGLAVPRYTAFNTSVPDYAKNADLVRAIELKYAYNPDKAKEVIDAEMTALGATLEGGKWMYNGQPVTLIFLIRPEDERKAIGDYIANELEKIGFTVDRQYKRAAEASPLWMRSDPAQGLWHLYTGGWVSTAISRDLGGNFAFFYTDMGLPSPLWQAYKNTPEFYEVAKKLNTNDFKTIEERSELLRQALELSMQDSVRVWLVDRVSFSAQRANIIVNADLSGSVYGSNLWAQTLRRKGEIGGSITIAMPSILTEPWNPVAGTNWIYDRLPQRGTGSTSVVPDPYTGLYWPMRIEKAECVVEEGLPVVKNLDWIDLSFAPKIEVPSDAWVDWDAASQKFITAGEKYTQTQTALTKCTVYYPADLYQTIKWHDGSPFSVADVVMFMILYAFDQAKPESPIYDEAAVPNFESFMSHFKGVKIVSKDPLIIETYDDLWYLDAELIPTTWWPSYGYGEAPWHTLVPAIRAEADGKLAFSADKSDANGVEWTSLIAGPSIEILNGYLVSSTAESYIPYAPTLGEFVTADEVATRYANLTEWVRTKGHFWVGTGPFYLERAFPLEGTLILKRFAQYPDAADRWERFAEARIATVEVAGADTVTIGKDATFDVTITFKDEPYPLADVEQVKYLVLDAKGQIATIGAAEAVADGQWKITLPADVTAKLEAGSNRLEVAAVLKVIALPAFGSMQFVTAP